MKQHPKNLKTSIRNKYNRRLRHLSHAVEQYLLLAEERLDESKSGRIYKRAEIEQIVDKCRELKALLPDFENQLLSEESLENFEKMLNQAPERTERILEEGKEFFENFSEEDWKQLREFIENDT